MITSDRQLASTKLKIESLQESLHTPAKVGVSKLFEKAAKIQAQSQIQELQEKVNEYEMLKTKGVESITFHDFDEVCLLPIKYRIASKMTQEAFAKFVNIQLRTLARYEAEDYQQISVKNLNSILHKIPLKMDKLKIVGRK